MTAINTITMPSPATTMVNADPFVYGWRQVQKIGLEGETIYERVPLTLEDLLHPQEDDYRMHNFEHEQLCSYLLGVFQAQLAADPTAVVMADVRVAWDKPNLLPHTPDISVVFGVKQAQNWSTFYEAEEGIRPTLIVEVVSPSTRSLDLVDKLSEYEEAEVPFYVIIDSFKKRGKTQRRLIGYELTPHGYRPMPLIDDERLWLPPVRVGLALNDELGLECYDEHGTFMPNYAGLNQAKIKAENKAKVEAKARVQAQALAKAESKARAEAESRATEAETRVLEAESHLRDLEAELRRLKEA